MEHIAQHRSTTPESLGRRAYPYKHEWIVESAENDPFVAEWATEPCPSLGIAPRPWFERHRSMRTHGNAVSAIDAEFSSARYEFRQRPLVLEFNNLRGAFAYAYAVTFAFVRVNSKNAQILVPFIRHAFGMCRGGPVCPPRDDLTRGLPLKRSSFPVIRGQTGSLWRHSLQAMSSQGLAQFRTQNEGSPAGVALATGHFNLDRASRAAFCCASLLLRPLPTPTTSFPRYTPTQNVFWWSWPHWSIT